MEMTNSLRKIITSLSTVKGRREHSLFVVEGEKAIIETLPYFQLHSLWATPEWAERSGDSLPEGTHPNLLHKRDFDRISFLKNPQGVLSVYRLPGPQLFSITELNNKIILALDGIQDPGNLGTIIRIADWFGITTILASADTADAFSPKVVQATMGAIGRVRICYTDLRETIKSLPPSIPVYGTFLDGQDIFSTDINTDCGIIIMGNEGNGISPGIAELVTRRLLIPNFPSGNNGKVVESLNVGAATAITVAEFRRRSLTH